MYFLRIKFHIYRVGECNKTARIRLGVDTIFTIRRLFRSQCRAADVLVTRRQQGNAESQIAKAIVLVNDFGYPFEVIKIINQKNNHKTIG